MKKWLLALMICLSFSTLTAGLFLLPQYVEYVETQKQDDAEKQEGDTPARSMAGPKYIKISQRVVNSTSYSYSYSTLATQSYNSTRASWSSNSSIYTDVGLFKVQWYDENSGTQAWGADVHYYTTSSYTTQNNPTPWCGSMYYDYGGSWVAVNRKAMVTISPSSGYTMVGYGVGTGSSIPSWSYNSSASTLWMYGSGKVSTTKPTGTSTVPGSTDVHLCIYVCKKVTVTLTKNTNISYVYYKYNGKSSYDSVSYSSSVSVCVGSSFYGYATTPTGYEANYTSSSVYSKYSIASAFTFSPVAYGIKYAVTLNVNGASAGMTTNKTIYVRYMSSLLYSNSTLSDNTTTSWTNPTRTGHAFGGWVTKDGTNQTGTVIINTSQGLTASNGYTNSSSQWTSKSGLTVYAKWTANRYAITLYVNGATSGTNKTIYAEYGSSTLYANSTGTTTASVTNPTKTHNTFAGWSTSSSSSSGTIIIKPSLGFNENTGYTDSRGLWASTSSLSLYARWSAHDIIWHFMFEGGVDAQGGAAYINYFGASSESGITCELEINFGSAHGESLELWFNDRESFLLDIDQGGNGSFSLYADDYYRFTGLYYIDWGNDGEEYSPSPHTYEQFSVDDGAYDDVYIYFEMEKVLYVQSNNTSYGTVNVSEVWVPCIDNFSVTTSGKTATINDTTATATQNASTTGFTYAFGSWTWSSPLYPGYAITANFTRTTNTRSVTLAVRTINKAGTVGSSNAIPSGASLSVSYTNSTPSSTSSSQTSASTAYTIQAGTNMTITPTVPAGYKYVGYNTSASKPSVSSFPTSTTLSAPSAGTYYFFFQEVAAPLYYTTERGGYWYYEDGEYPQTYVGTSLSGTSATSSKFNINGTDYTVYTANGLKYIQVASPMTGSIKLNNGTTVSLTKGTKYWFRIDPIRWRVSNYGASASKYGLSSVTANLVGVSDILGHGRVNTTTSTFTKKDLKSEEMSAYTQSCSAVGYTNASTNMTYTFDKLNGDTSSSKTTTYTKSLAQASTLTVASLSNIQTATHNGTSQDNLKTYASDLSAMLQCRDYNNSTGWTSSIYNIGSGIVVGPGSGTRGAYWSDETNKFGFVYAHQASYATCLGTR